MALSRSRWLPIGGPRTSYEERGHLAFLLSGLSSHDLSTLGRRIGAFLTRSWSNLILPQPHSIKYIEFAKKVYNRIMFNLNALVNSLFLHTAGFLPTLIGAAILMFAGVILSNWLKKAVIKLAIATKASNLTKNPAIQDFLNNAQVTTKVEHILGETVRVIVLVFFVIATCNLLGLTSVSLLLGSLLSIVPNLFAALVILFLGVILAGFLEKLVKGSLGAGDPSLSRFAGRVVSYTTMTIFILAALSQLGIASFFIQVTYIGFILVLTLALGLGLGLGSKDIFKKILEDWYKKVSK